jgi:ABC-type lipoprotein release transport system permease subunit
MKFWNLILASLRFHWRAHLGVGLGALLASAILTGALLVGDSVKWSLRQSALLRLGRINLALQVPNRLFSADLDRALRREGLEKLAAILQLRGMALVSENDTDRQVNQVQVLGVDEAFWTLAETPLPFLPPGEVAVNARLAGALGIKPGDEIALRLDKPGWLPLDAPLAGHGEERSVRRRVRVASILTDAQLGRFSLNASQTVPCTVFVNRQWLQDAVEQPNRINLLVSGDPIPAEQADAILAKAWQPEHLGLRFRTEIPGFIQLESERIYLDPETTRAARRLPGANGTLTYLVNSLSAGGKSTPYSFMVAGAPVPELADNEIVINRWLASQLQAGPGTPVQVAWFALLANNHFEERIRTFTVRQVVEMPALAVERALAPAFPGLTDVDRCAGWDVGLPLDATKLADPANEAYWKDYRQTPKAIVTLKAGEDMWGNRFGTLTAVRWPAAATTAESLRQSLRQEFKPAATGLAFQPVRQQALAAAAGAQDFGMLFLGMSFFLIIAALLLTALLFAFGVQQRVEEFGILLALGWRPRTVHLRFLAEGSLPALLGVGLGAWLGGVYTQGLLWGLERYWQGAVANATILYHAEPVTRGIGAAATLACALGIMFLVMRRQTRHPARDLLAADFTAEFQPGLPVAKGRGAWQLVAWGGLLAAIAIAGYACLGRLDNLAPAFFAAGAALLTAGLAFCRLGLGWLECRASTRRPSLFSLALQNLVRRRNRSLAVIALLACGCFMTFAVASMKEDMAKHADKPWSGTGGFAWVAQSTLPIAGPLQLPGQPTLDGLSLRQRDGDEASCLNLNKTLSPRLLGVDPQAFATRKAFLTAGGTDKLWKLLEQDLPDGTIPALAGDANTAMWNLQKQTGPKGGLLKYRDEQGRDVAIRLVGALPMRLSVFQGSVLIANRHFTRLFPAESGFRLFLVNPPAGANAAATGAALTKAYERFGLDVVPATSRLLEFYAVESTYLAMFLVLGSLGVLIGTLGMGIVLQRNVLERRTELALLHAVGYSRQTLKRLLLLEHGILFALGLVVGGLAAAIAMAPALSSSQMAGSPTLLWSIVLAVSILGLLCAWGAVQLALLQRPLEGLRQE